MEPVEIYGAVVGLILMGDWDIFEDSVRDSDDFPPAALKVYREIGDTIVQVLHEYDFTKSVAFITSITGRSKSYIAAKIRFESEPVKRRNHRECFAKALKNLAVDDAAFELVAPDQHARLRRVRELLGGFPIGG